MCESVNGQLNCVLVWYAPTAATTTSTFCTTWPLLLESNIPENRKAPLILAFGKCNNPQTSDAVCKVTSSSPLIRPHTQALSSLFKLLLQGISTLEDACAVCKITQEAPMRCDLARNGHRRFRKLLTWLTLHHIVTIYTLEPNRAKQDHSTTPTLKYVTSCNQLQWGAISLGIVV